MRLIPLEVRWAYNRGWRFAWEALWNRVVLRRVEVHYSAGGDKFYVSTAKPRATFWLSVQTYPDDAPEVANAKENNWPGGGGLRFNDKGYNRLMWHFVWYKVHSGEMRFEPKTLPHVRDYLDCIKQESPQ